MKIFDMVGFGNYVFHVSMDTEERNKNTLIVHNQSMGKRVYQNDNIWDSDLTKIIRTLKKYEYSHMNIKDICKKLNKNCRHLHIYI